MQTSRKASLPSNTLHIARTTEGLEYLVQVRQELKAEKNAMALSFVTIHLALNMTTRLVGQPPQPTTPTPWPLRHHLSSQRWRPHAHPVPPLLLLYNITRGERLHTHALTCVSYMPSHPWNHGANATENITLHAANALSASCNTEMYQTGYLGCKLRRF